jgi:protein TonB
MFDNLRDILDFDDLLFEKRNREYGAFKLRKGYNSAVIIGIIAATLIVSSIVILPFIIKQDSDHILTGGVNYLQVTMEAYEPPEDQLFVPPAPPPPEATPLQEAVRYTPPVVVDSMPPLELSLSTTDQVLTQGFSDQIEVTGTGTGDELIEGPGGAASDEPFVFVEVMPSFKGGDINKFRDWVFKRTNYPQAAIDNKIRGTVFLTFIVERDGSVSNVTIIKGVDPLLDNEAVKAISESPKWTPGLQRGLPVRVRFQIPMNFSL